MNLFISLLAAAVSVVSITVRAEVVVYTPQDVAVAAEAAEAQFTRLKLVYTEDIPRWNAQSKLAGKAVQKRTVAFSHPEGWMLQATETVSDDLPNGELGEEVLASFDGRVTTYLQLKPSGRNHFLVAVIYNGRQDSLLKMLDTSKELHYRIFHFGGWSYNDFALNVVAQDEMLGDVHTIRLRGKAKKSNGEMEVWVARNQGFIPVKWTYLAPRFEDGRERQMEWNVTGLRKLENGMWYPGAASLVVRDRAQGLPDSIGESRYSITEVSAAALDISFFQPIFPPETHVNDLVNKRKYITPKAPTTGQTDAKSLPKADIMEQEIGAYVERARQQAHSESETSAK